MSILIFSTGTYPGKVLSNLHPNAFTFDGMPCASMEGLLQSFKFQDTARQALLCGMSGLDAKYGGRAGDGWKASQMLWWRNVPYDRHSSEYQRLLNQAYGALGENPDFQKALLTTGDEDLEHPIGSQDPSKTILTQQEFVARLTSLRLFYRFHQEEPNG